MNYCRYSGINLLMKKLFSLIILLLTFHSNAQIGMGNWRLHVPTSNAIDIVTTGNTIYVAYPNGVGEYDISENEMSVLTAVNGLSDVNITTLGLESQSGSVFVGYDNGNVDIIRGNAIFNIPGIKLAQIQGSKIIHEFVEHEGYIYTATGFSIVKIDPIKKEIRDTYYPTNGQSAILDLVFHNDTLFALTEDRVFKAYKNNTILADPSQWSEDTRFGVSPTLNRFQIESFNDSLYILEKDNTFGGDSIFVLRNTGLAHVFDVTFASEINDFRVVENELAICYYGTTIFHDINFLSPTIINPYLAPKFSNISGAIKANGTYFLSDKNNGLVQIKDEWNRNAIRTPGPLNNSFYAMDYYQGKMVFSSGGLNQIGNTYNQNGVHTFEDEVWKIANPTNQDKWEDIEIFDFLSVAINPSENKKIAVGTYSNYPLSIIDENNTVIDTFTIDNSILEPFFPNQQKSFVSSVNYDENGNLWVLNGYSDEVLKVYTADGNWYGFDLGSGSKQVITDDMIIDYNGNKWLTPRGKGLYGFNDNGSIASTNDDQVVILNSGVNSGALPSNEVRAIAVDFDDEIWIGTDNGFAILYNSESAFGASPGNYNAQRVKIEFEGNVEYVLGSTNISSIVVDGANRKWFGTANAGIILLSEDGLEIIEQHTMENSPLISNTILDLELNQETGELFIVTDKGLVSYRTDASYEDPEYSSVNVFPNPARPEFDGPITIQGIRYDSDVRITDVSGNLIYQTTSNGGTATWDGKTNYGDKVKSGVYLIWTAANEGKGRKVGKVVIVN